MGIFKETTDEIMGWLKGHGEINTVEFGDANEFDTSTITDFPYSYLIPIKITSRESLAVMTYQILFTDIYESSDENYQSGSDRYKEKLKVLDKMAGVAIDFQRAFELNTTVLQENLTADVVYDQRQNRVYGWMFEFSLTKPNIINCG